MSTSLIIKVDVDSSAPKVFHVNKNIMHGLYKFFSEILWKHYTTDHMCTPQLKELSHKKVYISHLFIILVIISMFPCYDVL